MYQFLLKINIPFPIIFNKLNFPIDLFIWVQECLTIIFSFYDDPVLFDIISSEITLILTNLKS
jgi:hypothetical protein